MTIEYLKVFENDSPRVKGLSFHPKRPWLLASLHTGLIQLWDYRMGYLISTFHEHEGPVRCVSFHPSQSLFVSGGDDSRVRVWNPQSSLTSQVPVLARGKGIAATSLTRSLFTLSGHLDYVRSVSFHSESPWILSSSDDQTIRIWNWQSRACIAVLTGHNHYVMCAAFGPPGKGSASNLVASASLDQTIRVWDISGLCKKSSTASSALHEMPAGSHYPGSQYGSAHGQPELFAMNEVMVKHILEGHDRGVNWVEFHPSGNYLVSAADDRQVKIWQLDGLRAWESDSLSGHFNNVSCATYAYGGEVILSNSEDRTIRVWDAGRKTCLHTIRRDNDRFWAIIGHPSEKESLFAASHDAGFVVFKLERERPAFCFLSSRLLYVQARALKACELRHLSDDQLSLLSLPSSPKAGPTLSAQTLALLAAKSGSNACPIGEAPRQLSYNASDGSVLLHYHSSSGAAFEFYPGTGVDRHGLRQAASGTLSPSLKGPARSVFFLTRNRFAVLEAEGRTVQIYTVQKELSKSVPLPFVARSMFPVSMTLVLLATQANDKLVLFDLQLTKALVELPTPSGSSEIRHVEWSPDHSLLAYSTKYQIFVYTKKLDVLVASVTSDVPIKSLLWWSDALSSPVATTTATAADNSGVARGQVLYYSTFFHVKYLLPSSAESGLLCQTPTILYLAAVRDRTLYALDRRAGLVALRIDPSEVHFKVALEKNDMDTVVRMISSGCLIGQSVIAYLRRKGYPQMALKYVKDPLTRFELAIECADLSIAFDMAQALDRESVWARFAEEALLLGHHGLVEVAYMRTKSYQKLLFLYLVTGQGRKIQKLKSNLPAQDLASPMLRMMCDLVLGETADMCRTLKESGQDMLCYLTARTNGHTELCEAVVSSSEAGDDRVSALELSLSAPDAPQLGPVPLLMTAALPGSDKDWPIVGTVDELVFEAHGGQSCLMRGQAGTSVMPEPLQPPSQLPDGMADAFHDASTSPYSDAGLEPAMPAIELVDANAWGIDDEAPTSPTAKSSPLSHHHDPRDSLASPVGAKAADAGLPTVGSHPTEISLANSTLALDHILNGSFEAGMQLLNRQYGIVHFALLKPRWMSIYSSARMLHPTGGFCAQSPSVADFIYDGAERESRKPAPVAGISAGELKTRLDAALGLTTQGKFADATALFRDILHALLLSPLFSTGELDEMRDTCREYIAALSMEMRRKSITLPAPGSSYSTAETAALKQAFLLVALFTHCSLRPIHKLLALRVALTLAYKYGNWKMTLGFGRRLLDLHPSEPTLSQTNKIVAACESQISQLVAAGSIHGAGAAPVGSADSISVPEYEPLMPFTVCHATWMPIYTKRAGAVADVKHCAFCAASYSGHLKEAVGCSVCELTLIE